MARLRAARARLCGCAALVGLLVSIGGDNVLGLVRDAGWLLVPLAAGHIVSLTSDAAAWRALTPPPRASVAAHLLARWVREVVNALLPAAQIGGEVAAVRLLARTDGRLGWPASIITLDLLAEFASMTVLGLAGALVLVMKVAPQLRSQALTVGAAILPPAAFALAFAQRGGLARRLATRLAGRWPGSPRRSVRLRRPRPSPGLGRTPSCSPSPCSCFAALATSRSDSPPSSLGRSSLANSRPHPFRTPVDPGSPSLTPAAAMPRA